MEKKVSLDNGIVDIAAALGVSAATVSRALNDHPRISDATKKRVKLKAKEMGYRPNMMASSLRSKKSNVVGLIVPQISMYFHAVFITALQNRLQNAGYQVIISQSNDSVSTEKALANTLYSSRVDALVVSLSLYTEEYSHFDGFINKGVPVLFFDRVPIVPYPGYTFKGDDYRGGYLAGNHLCEIGCKRIAYISGPLTSNIYIDRTNGFKFALNQQGLQLHDDCVFYQELSAANAREALKKLFAGQLKPDAIFACNDTTAVEVVEFARENGINIPGDLKVIGYSNDPRASIITPGITTIEQFPEQMAEKVSDRIREHLREPKEGPADFSPTVIPVSLIRRMST